jgi:DNA-binding CsgD family transcriptional regulator
MELRQIELALHRGTYDGVPAMIAAAREHLGQNDMEPQYELPLALAEMRFAAAHGRFGKAVSALYCALNLLPLLGQETYVWQLLVGGATVAADERGLPGTDEAEHRQLLTRLKAAARRTACPAPLWTAWSRRFDAELARAHGRYEPHLWADAAAAFEPYDYPYIQAEIQHRWAEALLESAGGSAAAGSAASAAAGSAGSAGSPGSAGSTGGTDNGGGIRDRAAELLADAHGVALRLGARPLREDVELLARRARLPLATEAGAEPAAAAQPVAERAAPTPQAAGAAGAGGAGGAGGPLGLTRREHDVLRLVAAGRTNRQIAEALFISPKTASVHVSNILGKLGVSGRGEAAALAHRMRLFAEAEPTG